VPYLSRTFQCLLKNTRKQKLANAGGWVLLVIAFVVLAVGIYGLYKVITRLRRMEAGSCAIFKPYLPMFAQESQHTIHQSYSQQLWRWVQKAGAVLMRCRMSKAIFGF
jgi:hypothetical protein